MAFSKSMMRLTEYNHGNLASGALNIDTTYDGMSTTLRYGQPARVSFTCQGDNTWRNLLSGNEYRGRIEIQGSDATSTDYASWQFRMTSPAYGVSSYSLESYIDGGWNTGSFAIQLTTSGSSHVLQFRYSSYYSSSNNGSFIMNMSRM